MNLFIPPPNVVMTASLTVTVELNPFPQLPPFTLTQCVGPRVNGLTVNEGDVVLVQPTILQVEELVPTQ